MIAASKMPVAAERSNKSDRRDAAALARLDGKGMLSAIYVPRPQEAAIQT